MLAKPQFPRPGEEVSRRFAKPGRGQEFTGDGNAMAGPGGRGAGVRRQRPCGRPQGGAARVRGQ